MAEYNPDEKGFQRRLRNRYEQPHEHRATYKIFPDDARPSKSKILLSRIAAALLCAFCASISVLCLSIWLDGALSILGIILLLLLAPSAVISAIGIFHPQGLYYLRVYESETHSKKNAPKDEES